MHADDILLSYISGYGLVASKADDFYLSSSEINPKVPRLRGFSFDELVKTMQECGSKKIFSILNCFYDGTAAVTNGNTINGNALGQTIIENKSKMNGQEKCILATCRPLQDASFFKEHNKSPFTFFLSEGLAGAKGETIDSDGNVTPKLLHRYISNKLMELSSDKQYKQKPFLKCDSADKIILASHPQLISRDDIVDKLKKEITALSERLKVSEERQQELVNIVVHELKNSIQTILLLTESLVPKNDARQRVLRDLFIRKVKGLSQIVGSDLMAINIEKGPMRITKERFSLKDLISEIIQDYSVEIKARMLDINLSLELEFNEILVEADRMKLTRLISNLLDNAIKFTKKGVILVKLENTTFV